MRLSSCAGGALIEAEDPALVAGAREITAGAADSWQAATDSKPSTTALRILVGFAGRFPRLTTKLFDLGRSQNELRWVAAASSATGRRTSNQ
ncbi:MAG: hypothetical protein GY953_16665 [bacterium]|nr:hypothetical protein [bacterium]